MQNSLLFISGSKVVKKIIYRKCRWR